MAERCYALAGGSYSDYRVYAVFAEEADAQAALDAYAASKDAFSWGGPDRVEVHRFYPKGVLPTRVTAYGTEGEIFDDGTASEERHSERTEWDYDQSHPVGPRPWVRFVRPPVLENKGGRLEVWGTDPKGVAQAFGENKARIQMHAVQHGKAKL